MMMERKINICMVMPFEINEYRGDKIRELRNAKTFLKIKKQVDLHIISPGPMPDINAHKHEIKIPKIDNLFLNLFLVYVIGFLKAFYVSIKYRPDIFFVRGELQILIAWFMKKLFGIPFIVDMIFIDLDFSEKWFEKEEKKGRTYIDINQSNYKSKYGLHNKIAKIFNKFAYNEASLFTMEMDFQIRMLNDMGIEKERLFQLLPSINLERFKPQKNKEEYDAIFIGSLDDSHLRMITPVIERLPDKLKKYTKFKLVIVGGGKLENQLKYFIKTKNLQKNVIVLGEMPNEKVRNILGKSKIALAFSTGQKCYEYCAMGKPTVAFSGENSYSVLKDAALYAKNWDEYTNNIFKLYKDEELYLKLSKNARKLAESRHIDKISKDLYVKIKNITNN